jgi:hypothetical protein
MTRLQARLSLFAVAAIFVATASNALFLQDHARLLNSSLPSTAVSLTQLPGNKAVPDTASAPDLLEQDPKAPRLHVALQRELARRGYSNQLRARPNGLRLAILAYEFDNHLALTGEPTEDLLKRVLFDSNQGSRGSFTDRAEFDAKLVREAQKVLAGLGFFRGTFSGRMDVWTSNAIRDFERHRGIPLSGRLTEQTLLELITYSGQPIRLSQD